MKPFLARPARSRVRSGMIHRRALLAAAFGSLPLPGLAQLSLPVPEDAPDAAFVVDDPIR